jgi:hypothetical protein
MQGDRLAVSTIVGLADDADHGAAQGKIATVWTGDYCARSPFSLRVHPGSDCT